MYKCEFPDCKYVCDDRNQIHSHHIVPKELGGSDKSFNRISVCPNCHTRIYVEKSTSGMHSIRNKNSVVLKTWLLSTDGRVLEYIDEYGETKYHFNKE